MQCSVLFALQEARVSASVQLASQKAIEEIVVMGDIGLVVALCGRKS